MHVYISICFQDPLGGSVEPASRSFWQQLQQRMLCSSATGQRPKALIMFYKIRQPKYTLSEAKRRDTNYSVKIYTLAQLSYLTNVKDTSENE